MPMPGIAHLEQEPHLAVGALAHRHVHHDLAVLGELYRVSDQVDENLAQAYRVPAQQQRHIGIDEAGQLQLLGVSALAEYGGHVFDAPAQIELDTLDTQLACLETRELQDAPRPPIRRQH